MAKTNDNRPSPYKAKGPPCGENGRLRKLFATKEIGCKWRPELMHGAEVAAAINILFTNRNLLVVIFIGKPIRRTDMLLSRDTGAWGSDHDE